ncbi:hypothetical protein LEN26_016861 [Aphanomyces euteiches]|uniref:PARP-type domain-containing protein n=1 Tax=Aphanomyces euteiches TaxID=100861 RepID=A0A6G0XJQ1_9STRA|nr:hypothetical protein Ae201684_004076 [Aphanomyces euteiches]KAH9094341.1 hypothetical protein Ae201684P_016950 [Aphanomyces euteiches]KAH9097925.1 hypothetical protein LEN26_016861 [Aphanomyces euteiches]KAH9111955.1 hypothetical protein AeMF1_013607 [Aphanomyces euteiches]KAH9153749.1 hypothetical protein AeRB84_004046 [Aphanomyces euteiches]
MAQTSPWSKEVVPVLGKAASTSSICQSCQLPIAQGHIRVGLIFHHMNGYIGLDWHHLACCETPEQLPFVEGYDLLTPQDQDVIRALATTTSS